MLTNRMLAVGLLIGTSLFTQLAQAEHVYYRNGSTVYKYHGLNANGAAVLTSAFQAAPGIIGAIVPLVGRDAEPATRAASTTTCKDLAEQQQKANELLTRTAA